MSNDVDYYDVQAMIRDERSAIRAEIDAAVRDACRELRSEFDNELESLSHAIHRVLDERTAHLA